MVKNLPYNAGDSDSVPGRGTKIPHASSQLSQHTATIESKCSRTGALQQEKPTHHILQLEKARMLQQRSGVAKMKKKLKVFFKKVRQF